MLPLATQVNNRSSFIELFALVAGSVAVWWHPIAATSALALNSDAHTHILLILPLGVALAYVESKGKTLAFKSRGWMGAGSLTAALFLRGLATWNIWHLSSNNQLSLNMFALVIWWIGSVIFSFGSEALKLLLFPLCFLFLIVPFPEQVLKWITEALQHQSAVATSMLFRCAQIPVKRDGILLSIPGLDIEVARECSSIRSSMMLIVTTMILAQLFLRSWWRKTLLVAAAVPLSVAKNAVRIFTITGLATRVDPSFLEGQLHRNGGIVFLGLAAIVVLVLLWALRRSELRRPLSPSAL